ncbi:MAG: PRC-barrel domain-containing protein [Elainellaceae cyanobacterium]
MNIPENSIRQSSLPGRLILDYDTTEGLGRVDCIWLDPQTHAVAGLISREGSLGRRQHLLPWGCIKKIGEGSILVEGQRIDANTEKAESVTPIVGREIWTDDGSKVGHVVDYFIHLETGAVVSYLFKSEGWSGLMGGVYHLPSNSVESIGSKRLIAQAEAVRQSEKYQEGLEKSISSAQERIKGDLAKTKDDLTTATEKGQALSEHLKETTQSVIGQVKKTLNHMGQSSKEEP